MCNLRIIPLPYVCIGYGLDLTLVERSWPYRAISGPKNENADDGIQRGSTALHQAGASHHRRDDDIEFHSGTWRATNHVTSRECMGWKTERTASPPE
jgi:hypothetical protein